MAVCGSGHCVLHYYCCFKGPWGGRGCRRPSAAAARPHTSNTALRNKRVNRQCGGDLGNGRRRGPHLMQPSFSGLFVTWAYLPARSVARENTRPGAMQRSRARTPDDLARVGDEAQLADVNLEDGPFGDHAKRRVHSRLRVFLDAQDLELECGLRARNTHRSSCGLASSGRVCGNAPAAPGV